MASTTVFTDALSSCGLVPLPASIERAADGALAAKSDAWVLRNWIALETEANVNAELSAGARHHAKEALNAITTVSTEARAQVGREVLSALRLRRWRQEGEYLVPASFPGGSSLSTFNIETSIDPALDPEAYRLRCRLLEASTRRGKTPAHGTSLCVTVEAATPAGFFYAGTTLAAFAERGLLGEGCVVEDMPRFPHRGIMVDVARSFLPLEALRDLIRAAAILKLNVLHLHLVDDQGWRIEITNDGRDPADSTDYTALHRIGGLSACNPGTDPGFDMPGAAMSEVIAMNAGFESVAAGIPGYYTQAELCGLVAYAASLHVRLVPELEFPGHNHVVLHALPHLATAGASMPDEGEGVPPWTRWQVGHSYLDFDNEDTWRFARHVMRQVGEIFGSEHLHLGGDEALKMLRTLGQEKYDEVVTRVVAQAKTCGFERVTLWQEGAMSLTTPTDSVQLWNYGAAGEVERLMKAAADRNLRIINSDARHIYLDQKITVKDVLGLTWACPEGLPTPYTYEWDPLEVFPPTVREQVIGIEACLWSETVRGPEDAATLLFPRLTAIAEVAWSPQERRCWEDFYGRVFCDETA